MITSLFFVCVAIIFMILIIYKVKKKRFFEKESFLWVIGSIFVLLLAIFPNFIGKVSRIVGIDYPPSLLFLVATIFILVLSFRQSEQVSLLKEQVKDLGQRIVVLEKIIEKKENEK